MSWKVEASHIGPRLTIEQWSERVKEEARTAEMCSPYIVEQIQQIDSLVRSEIRRLQDANPFSEWRFYVCAYGHAEDPAKGEGTITFSVQIQWHHAHD